MIQRTVSAGPANLPLVAMIGISTAMLAVRLAETPSEPMVYLRVLFTLTALTVVCAGRRNLLRSASLAFALEATGGILTFVYVDAPFVNAHRSQIGSLALSLADRLEGTAQRQEPLGHGGSAGE